MNDSRGIQIEHGMDIVPPFKRLRKNKNSFELLGEFLCAPMKYLHIADTHTLSLSLSLSISLWFDPIHSNLSALLKFLLSLAVRNSSRRLEWRKRKEKKRKERRKIMVDAK